jgi:transposase-like protein
MWFITNQKHGISALGLQRLLGMSRYKTTWTWLHKIRVAMVRPGRDALSGTVEVDETYIGGKKPGKRGRGAAGKTLVLVVVEDKDNALGRIRLKRVKNGEAASLIPAVKECVQGGALIRTDGWVSYGQLTSNGYRHKVVRKDANLGENMLPLVNRVTSLLKKWLSGTLQGAILPSHIDYYLDEFTFRFNRRASASRGKLFSRLIEQAIMIGPVMNTTVEKPRIYS